MYFNVRKMNASFYNLSFYFHVSRCYIQFVVQKTVNDSFLSYTHKCKTIWNYYVGTLYTKGGSPFLWQAKLLSLLKELFLVIINLIAVWRFSPPSLNYCVFAIRHYRGDRLPKQRWLKKDGLKTGNICPLSSFSSIGFFPVCNNLFVDLHSQRLFPRLFMWLIYHGDIAHRRTQLCLCHFMTFCVVAVGVFFGFFLSMRLYFGIAIF